MTLSHSPSEDQSQAETSRLLSKEAQARVDAFAIQAIDLLNQNPEKKEITIGLLDDNLRRLITNYPGEVRIELNEREKKYQESLAKLNPVEKIEAEKKHSTFLDKTCNFINSCAQNIQWDDQFKVIHGEYINKKESFNGTYHTIQNNLCSQITGKGFPIQTV